MEVRPPTPSAGDAAIYGLFHRDYFPEELNSDLGSLDGSIVGPPWAAYDEMIDELTE